jgi:hypothetical protein
MPGEGGAQWFWFALFYFASIKITTVPGYRVVWSFGVLEYWSDSIVDLGLWIAELYKEYDPILINPIRNLKSAI